jgi:hypothetical protein
MPIGRSRPEVTSGPVYECEAATGWKSRHTPMLPVDVIRDVRTPRFARDRRSKLNPRTRYELRNPFQDRRIAVSRRNKVKAEPGVCQVPLLAHPDTTSCAPYTASVRRDTSDVRQDTTSVRRDTSGVRRDTSGVRRNTSGVRRNTTSVRPDTAGVRRDTSGVRRDTSGVRRDTSGVRRDTSGVRRDTSGVRRDTAGVRENTASVRRDTLGVRRDTSGARRDTTGVRWDTSGGALGHLGCAAGTPRVSPGYIERPSGSCRQASSTLAAPARKLDGSGAAIPPCRGRYLPAFAGTLEVAGVPLAEWERAAADDRQ